MNKRAMYFLLSFLCVGLALLLATRTFFSVRHRPFPLPRETNSSLIQDWMTITYVSRTYGVPDRVFAEKLSIDESKLRRVSIKELARSESIDTATLLIKIQEIIRDFQAEHTAPPKPPQP